MNTLLKLATVATIGLMAWSAQAQDKLVFLVANRGEFTITLNKAADPKRALTHILRFPRT